MRARLRDMEGHLEQFGPVLLQEADGRLLLAWASLLPDQADIEPYPHSTPRLQLPGLLEDEASVDFTNEASIRRIEQSMDGYGIHNISDTTGTQLMARANPAGFKRQHDLQVVWLGSRRQWRVLEGGVRWREYDDISGDELVKQQVFSATDLDQGSGWIVLQVQLQPLSFDSRNPHILGDNGYTLVNPEIILFTSPVNNPPVRTLTSGEVSPGLFWSAVDWSVGTMLLPIAYVEAPGYNNRISPFIAQIARGSWSISSLDAIATWAGTLPRSSFTRLAAP